MSKPHHMRPPGRPMKRTTTERSPMVPTEKLCNASTAKRDAEHLDLILALGKIGRPIKPPKRRAQ